MSVKISIESELLKSWGKVVHTLATTGESDIYFHIASAGVTLSTVDSSASVFCTCTFEKAFFFRYEVPREGVINFRIPAKCLLKPFKSLKFLQKFSDSCELELSSDGCALLITMPCRGGIRIRHRLNLSVEAEDLQVEIDSTMLKNCIASEPKLILGSLSNFTRSKGVADLTLKVLSDKLLLKNCVNDLIKREGKVYTELKMNSADFNVYNVEVDSELTFPMREFKTFVAFAEQLKLSLKLNFQGADKPLLVTAESGRGIFTAKLILATTLAGHLGSDRAVPSTPVPGSAKIIGGTFTSNETSSGRQSVPASPAQLGLNPSNSVWAGPSPAVPSSEEVNNNNSNNNNFRDSPRPSNKRTFASTSVSQSLLDPMEVDQNVLPVDDFREDMDGDHEEITRKRMRLLFPNLGRPFDPAVDVPGYNEILVGCSDDEEDT